MLILTRLWAKTPCPHQVRAPVDAGEFGAVPSVASFEVVDPSFGSGSPFDFVAEGSSVFELAAGRAGFACARDRHTAHAEGMKVVFDRCVAVATVGGYRPWWAPDAAGDPFDRRRQLRCVCGVSDLDAVVEDDAVGVVDDLGFVAELHRLAQPSFTDRASIGIVQADHPDGRIRHHPSQSATGLRHHPLGAPHDDVEVVDRLPSRPLRDPLAVRSPRRALRITAIASRIVCSAISASSPVIRCTAAWA